MRTSARSRRHPAPATAAALTIAAAGVLAFCSPAATAGTTAVPAAEPLECAVIVAQDTHVGFPTWRWADVRNDCGRRMNLSVQVSGWPDPECQYLAPTETKRFRWDSTGGPANYAWDCGG
ncbi:hypothetical protein [Embleya hyalina]|uniref:Uncharacterized protein n=1 Tax=Embleya hyalina TaxID=516124 RepID=A0A401YM48_9ACTN|nr:hypothetical protein [Embleya hyalina]GCD95694.1 hypothetical protein EHYA_03377 [Embleya hyalina]